MARWKRVCAAFGLPTAIRVDLRRELVSCDLDPGACAHDMTLEVSRPGKLTENRFIEASTAR